MSVHTVLLLRDDRLPTIAQWQQALDAAGLDLQLDDVGDLRVHEGYLPATFRGEPSGFEWYLDDPRELFDEPPEGLDDFDRAIDFVTHSDMWELATAMLAGAILAQLTGGRVFHEESGGLIDGDAALAQAQQVAAEL